MKLDEDAVAQRVRAGRDKDFSIVRITPTVTSELAAEAKAARSSIRTDSSEENVYEYRIAPLDVLQVTVWDHPELTTPSGNYRSPEENGNRVNANGEIYYPHVGVVQVAGKTTDEVREVLRRELDHVINNPQLDVRIAAFHGRKAQVTGEVVMPSTIPITDVPMRVQDAIAMAKGFTVEADWANVSLVRDGHVIALNLQALYEQGDLSQNRLLKDGDVLHVGDRSRSKVFVLGEVKVPQSKFMVRGRLTLAEALNETGGLEPAVANVGKIYVIRGDYDSPKIYHLDASSPDAFLLAAQFPLKPRDVVFVSTYGLAQWNRVFLQILPTIQGLWDTYDMTSRAVNSIHDGTMK